jgi:hypothetical protein
MGTRQPLHKEPEPASTLSAFRLARIAFDILLGLATLMIDRLT